MALQYGVPLKDLVNKFAHVRFEPSGFTGNQEIPIAKSIVDYIFRWLGSRFLSPDDKANLGLLERVAVDGGSRRQLPSDSAAGPRAAASLLSAEPSPRSPSLRRRRPSRHPATETESPRRPQSRPSRLRSRRQGRSPGMAVMATNPILSNGNGHAANGNGKATNGKGTGGDHPEPRRHQGQLPGPGRRPQLRRMRLDHDPQRQLLQVPQLRQHLGCS